MAVSDQVGSLDEWLATAPLASERQASPFAAVSQAARGPYATQAMPSASPSNPSFPDLDHQSTYLQRVVCVLPACASGVPRGDLLASGGSCDHERTVRHGRLRPTPGTGSDAQPIARTACRSLTAPSKYFESVASLPAIATQATISLESLCTALSSPASHVTLATAANDRRSYNGSKIQTAAVDSAAATAAFNQSMTAIQLPSSESPSAATSPASLLPHIAVCQYVKLPLCTITEAASASPMLPPIGSSDGCRFDVISSSERSGAASPGSGRRGLSEGTVRGGSPRNSWRYGTSVQQQ